MKWIIASFLAAVVSIAAIVNAYPQWSGVGLNSTTTAPPVIPPGIPAPAQAAGFTTLALNADFTSPAYSNKATFIKACGASSGLRWYWAQFFTTTDLGCGDITITSDGSIPQVLFINYATSEWGSTTHEHGFSWPNYIGQASCGTGSTTGWAAGCLPAQMYVETVFRTDDASWNQNGGSNPAHLNFYTTGLNYNTSGTRLRDWWEPDLAETTGTGTAFNSLCGTPLCVQFNLEESTQGGGSNQILAFGYQMDYRVYHKLGFLVTSDGSSAFWACIFIDDNFQSPCRTLTPGDANILLQHDNVVVFEMDWFGDVSGPGPNNLKFWIQYVKVWECANYQTASCTGTMVTHWPFP